jgi:hypothetical protein
MSCVSHVTAASRVMSLSPGIQFSRVNHISCPIACFPPLFTILFEGPGRRTEPNAKRSRRAVTFITVYSTTQGHGGKWYLSRAAVLVMLVMDDVGGCYSCSISDFSRIFAC